MSTRNAFVIAVAGLAVSPAFAGPTGSEVPGGAAFGSELMGGPAADRLGTALSNLRTQMGGGGSGGGFTDDPPVPAAHPSSIQSMSLRMLGLGGATGFVNSLGEVDVQLNTGFHSLGTNPAGKQLLGQVRQFIAPDNRIYIEAEYKTSDGTALVPVSTTVGGQPAVAYGWELGTTNPIDWYVFWDYVNVPQDGAIASFFGPGGNASVNHTPELVGPLGGPWDGRDSDNMLIALGDLFNRVLIRYEVQPVPTPSVMGLAGIGLALAGRRRRR